MNKKQRSMMLILVMTLVIGLGSITYAYWTTNTENKISNNTTIQTGVLKLVLDDGTNKDGVLTGTIDPNNTKFTTYLSITNEGTYDTFAKLYFKGLINTFSSDLVYSIEEVDSLPNNGSTPKIVKRFKYQVPVPSADSPSRELLADGLLIKMGTLNGNNLTPNTEYYRVTIEYLWSETKDQSDDLGKQFYTGFDIEQGDKLTETIVMLDNIEDLVELANEVNAGDNKSGKEYRLMRNLDFNSDDSYLDATTTKYGDINKNGTVESIKTELTTSAGWTPIGAMKLNPFSGTFNGQNNELQHLYISNSNSNITETGLFGWIINGNVTNLGVRDIDIFTSVNASIGGITAVLIDGNVENCYNIVTISNENISNISSSFGSHSLGGIVGGIDGNAKVENCYNDSNINNGRNTGGIVGYIGEEEKVVGTIEINNCHNKGNINKTIGYSIGGIVGNNNGKSGRVIINDSDNTGKLKSYTNSSSTSIVGGIVGSNSAYLMINNSKNSGNITYANNGIHYNYAAGIIGFINENNTIINNSINTGKVSNCSHCGGIVGVVTGNTNIIINKCSNIGNIETATGSCSDWTSSGGIIANTYTGYNETPNPHSYIINSYNKGNIKHNLSRTSYNEQSGGIEGASGSSSNSYIINSYNHGDVEGIADYTSGILGYSATKDYVTGILNTYNLGDVKSSGSSYGVMMLDFGTHDIANTYFKTPNTTLNTNTISASNKTINATGMSLSQMQNSSFVTALNNNLSSITLPSELNGYTLSTWCTSDNGPVLDYQVPESERAARCPAYNN